MRRSGIFDNKHIWLSPEYSMPSDEICLDAAPSPDADCFCLKAIGHKGAHEYTYQPRSKSYSWKDRCVHHDDRPVREIIDGDMLCQDCCDNWVKGEGVAANERAREHD